MKTLWGGRFKEEADGRMMAFTSSLHFDMRLLPHDVAGSLAHVAMLQEVGLLTPEEGRLLTKGLNEILEEARNGTLPSIEVEDVHTFVENLLREKVGEAADKLHTARSRNDQVALDMKLYLLEASGEVLLSLKKLKTILLDEAEENMGVIMPGYTHLQPAQPVLLSHHLLAYFEKLHRDSGRFHDARRRGREMPLGSGALAGTSLPIDRQMVAEKLGFRHLSRNSLDAVSERDFPLEFSAAAAITMVHLSRLAGELVLWSSPAFGFVELPDRLATGSSMMPQKKNPDVAELVRGKSARVFGNLMSLMALMKGLPLAYQRDLQEDKEAVFDTVDTLLASIESLGRLLEGLSFNAERMAEEALRGYITATDLAEYLVARGLPFRQAHALVGGIVRQALSRGSGLDSLSLEELRSHSPLFDEDVREILTAAGSVKSKKSKGSTAPPMVAEAITSARQLLLSEGGDK